MVEHRTFINAGDRAFKKWPPRSDQRSTNQKTNQNHMNRSHMRFTALEEFAVMSASLVVDENNIFGFGFTTFNRK